MIRIVRSFRVEPLAVNEGNPLPDKLIEPSSYGNRSKPLPWLAGVIGIFALLYSSSYLALLWLPPYKEADMRSQIIADYSPWAFLAFQPVDPAIIEEIRQEEKLPEQLVVDGSFWPTSSITDTTLSNVATQQPGSAPTAIQGQTSMPIATSDILQPNVTAIQSPNISTPMLTEITSLPEPVDTPQPTESIGPTTPPKPERPPKKDKPPKEEKPPREDRGNPH